MGDELWEKQVEILKSVWSTPETCVYSAHSAGKSHTASRAVVAWLRAWWPDVLVEIFAPSEVQLRGGIWQELLSMPDEWKALIPGEIMNGSPLMIKDADNSGMLAIGRAPAQGKTVPGLHNPNLLVIVEEATDVEEDKWTAIYSHGPRRILAIGNPTHSGGEFHRLCTAPPDPRRTVIGVSGFDMPNLDDLDPDAPDIIARLEERAQEEPRNRNFMTAETALRYYRRSPIDYETRVLGHWQMTAAEALIQPAWVAEARERAARREGEPLYAGLDVAGFGPDTSVLMLRRGGVVYEPIVWHRKDPFELADDVLRIIAGKDADHPLPGGGKVKSIRIDKGYEPGVWSYINDRASCQVIGVDFGGKAYEDEAYENRRAEMYYSLARRFREGEREDLDLRSLDPETYKAMAEELTTLRRKDPKGKKSRIESKDEWKKRIPGGRSPDLADALALAFTPERTVRVY